MAARIAFALVISFIWTTLGLAAVSRGPADPNLYVQAIQLSIPTASTGWMIAPVPQEERDLIAVLRSPEIFGKGPATLTVRTTTDVGGNDLKIRKFVLKSFREYPKYGYKILGQAEGNIDGSPTFILDADNKKTGNRIRQAITKRPEGLVIFTCTGPSSNGKVNAQCDQMLRSARWASRAGSATSVKP